MLFWWYLLGVFFVIGVVGVVVGVVFVWVEVVEFFLVDFECCLYFWVVEVELVVKGVVIIIGFIVIVIVVFIVLVGFEVGEVGIIYLKIFLV